MPIAVDGVVAALEHQRGGALVAEQETVDLAVSVQVRHKGRWAQEARHRRGD